MRDDLEKVSQIFESGNMRAILNGLTESTCRMARKVDELENALCEWMAFASSLNMKDGQSIEDAKAQVDEVFDAMGQLKRAICNIMHTSMELEEKTE